MMQGQLNAQPWQLFYKVEVRRFRNRPFSTWATWPRVSDPACQDRTTKAGCHKSLHMPYREFTVGFDARGPWEIAPNMST